MIVFLVITLLIAANALYVAAEFSSISSRRTRMVQMAGEGNRAASSVLAIINSPKRLDNFIAACQLGITVSSLTLGLYGQSRLADILRPWLSSWTGVQDVVAESTSVIVVLVILTTLQVLLGELVPKSIGVRYPERLATITVPLARMTAILFSPLTWFFNGTGNLLLKLLSIGDRTESISTPHPEEIGMMVSESAESGLLDGDAEYILRNILAFGNLTAKQVMIPRPRIEAASIDASPNELLSHLADSAYTRLPIYRDRLDHIVGFIHLKDLFRVCHQPCDEAPTLESIVRNVPFVPETMPVDELWNVLNRDRHYMAIVFDEYGGTAGLITQEDLIEEVFGDLQDEFDDEGPLVVHQDDHSLILRGDLMIEDINELILINLPTDRANTIGGLVSQSLQSRPRVGDTINVSGVSLEVVEVEDLAINRVCLRIEVEGVPPQEPS
ncbi:MAG: hemolysin family protein [Chloroflexota bacterium]